MLGVGRVLCGSSSPDMVSLPNLIIINDITCLRNDILFTVERKQTKPIKVFARGFLPVTPLKFFPALTSETLNVFLYIWY